MGIIFAYLFLNKSWLIPYFVGISLIISYLLFINNFYKKLKAYNFKGYTGIVFYGFFFAFGGLSCLLNTQTFNDNYFANQEAQILKVWVANEPEQNGSILRFEANVCTQLFKEKNGEKVSGKLLVALKTDSLNPVKLNYGDELIISAIITAVEPPYNPAEFDFKKWLASKNVYHQTFINQLNIIKLGTNNGNFIIKYAIEVRQRQVAIYRKLIQNNEAFAVASTLVLGYRSDLNKETLAAYSKTGTIHALSVSGMHVGIIYIFLNWLLFFLDRNKKLKILKVSTICTLIWYYALLTGFSPSVLRSAIMLSVFILAKTFNQNSNSFNIVAFTAFCLLCYQPFLIWDVGFELSFLAVLGLIYLQPKIYKWFYFKNKWIDKLWGTVALSLAAQIATFPFSIYYFHQFPVYFIFSNLFILLPLTIMMYLGIVILLLKLYFLAPMFEWVITFTNNGLKWIADLPFSGISGIWLNKWQLILLSIALTLLVVALSNYKKKLLFGALFALLAFQSISLYTKIAQAKQQKIVFFSLRKNYAAAFIQSKEAIVVTDLLSNDKNYEFFIKPALHQMQITNIHFVKWEQDTIINSFIKKQHQLLFNNYKILLLDSSFNYKTIHNLPKFEAVWLHQNPKKDIKDLRNEVQFSTLLIDASNKDYKIEQYKEQANKIYISPKILKKNKAYLIKFK